MTGPCLALVPLAWLTGVAGQLQQRELWATWTYGACLAVAVTGLALAWRAPRAVGLAVAAMAPGLLAFGLTGLSAAARLADALDPALEGRTVEAVGVVASLPQRSPDGLRFRFEVESAREGGREVRLPSRLSIGWYVGQNEDAALRAPRQALRAGQRWRLQLRLKQPHGNLNPFGFDYELTLFEQGVRATGYVHDAEPLLMERAAAHPVERLRQSVRDRIDAAVPDTRAAGVIAALSVGDQSAIAREDWDLFRATGVAHLVSISGVHVTMFAWLAGWLIDRLWRSSARAMLWWPAPQVARWGGFAAALGYALFSGWGVPSQRTVWMLATVCLLQALGVRWPWSLVLSWVAVVVSALDPWALLQPGFWLSFSAVGLLMLAGSAREDAPEAQGWTGRLGRHLGGELRAQVVATLGLTPLTLVFFQQVSLVGFGANLFAIPLVTLVITPLALGGALFTPLWWLAARLVKALVAVLAWIGGSPAAVWSVPVAPAWAQAAGLLAAALLLLPAPWRLRSLALPLVVPLMVPPLPRPAQGGFELLALDVGQGSALLVRTRGHLLVFDSGPRYTADSDAGQRVLLPLLKARGEWRVDRLVLSHRDLDHVGGASALLGLARVDEVTSSLEDGHPLRRSIKSHTRCEQDQSWTWDCVRFDMLAPPAASYALALKSNAMSCVLRVSGMHHSALLTGDIERAQETALVTARREALASDVLIAPHHGSKTSSSPAFVDAVHPRTAVFQAGYRNRFGHPAPEVLARYRERGIELVQTPDCGAWRWSPPQPEGVCERDISRRYWRYGAEVP